MVVSALRPGAVRGRRLGVSDPRRCPRPARSDCRRPSSPRRPDVLAWTGRGGRSACLACRPYRGHRSITILNGVQTLGNSFLSRSARRALGREPLVFGTLCGLAAALGYTAANACLRAVSDCDAVWVSCVKAFPTVALLGPVLAVRLVRRVEWLPPPRQMLVLVAVAIQAQLCGNVLFQWSLGVVGMALAVPLALGTMILSGAALGRIVLHEPVTPRMALAMIALIGAIIVLSLGASEAARVITRADRVRSPQLVAAGVAAACLSGVAYALLSAAIRYAVRAALSIPMALVTVTLTGVISLGAVSWVRLGLPGLLETARGDFGIMLLAGLFNAAAFLALAKSLQLIPLVRVNALNATQATMAAVTGVVVFAERSSPTLWFGVALTALGLVMMRRERARRRLPAGELVDGTGRTREDVREPHATIR